MTTRAHALALTLAATLAWSCAAETVHDSELHRFRTVTVADGLEHPWGMAFLPGGDLLVTERPGRLRVISGGRLEPAPVEGRAQLGVQTPLVRGSEALQVEVAAHLAAVPSVVRQRVHFKQLQLRVLHILQPQTERERRRPRFRSSTERILLSSERESSLRGPRRVSHAPLASVVSRSPARG